VFKLQQCVFRFKHFIIQLNPLIQSMKSINYTINIGIKMSSSNMLSYRDLNNIHKVHTFFKLLSGVIVCL